MPDPTLPLPTEPVPYFDPTAATPLEEVYAEQAAKTVPAEDPPAEAWPAEIEPVSAEPVAAQPPVMNAPPQPVPYAPSVPYAQPQPGPYAQPQPGPYAQPQPLPQIQQHPAPLPVPTTPPPIVAHIGDVQVSSTTIYTPIGEIPLRGSQWTVTDQWHAAQKTPTWAIVLAIVLFFCLTVFSLLFLLAKEVVYTGMVQVVITNGSRHYVTRVPVTSQVQVSQLHQQVNYVRSLAAL